MKERHQYRTHFIDLELIEVRRGLFRWHYQIDALHSGKSTDLLHDESNSRADALLLAQLEIDQVAEIAAATDASSHGFVARAAGGRVTIVGRYAWGSANESAMTECRVPSSTAASNEPSTAR